MTVPIPAVFDVLTAGWADQVAAWGQPWTPFTPVLTAGITNPTLGTGGSAQGRYIQIGKFVVADVNIAFGSSGASAGSGTYFISTPVPQALAFTGIPIGDALIKTAGLFTRVLALSGGASLVHLNYPTAAVNGGLAVASNSVPGVWTNNDAIWLRLGYECA